jgi:hypothetical protein
MNLCTIQYIHDYSTYCTVLYCNVREQVAVQNRYLKGGWGVFERVSRLCQGSCIVEYACNILFM